MRVAVKQSELEGHLHEDAGPIRRDRRGIMPGSLQSGPIRDLETGEKLHGQHAFRGLIPVDPGNAQGCIMPEEALELLDRAAFSGEIELATDRA